MTIYDLIKDRPGMPEDRKPSEMLGWTDKDVVRDIRNEIKGFNAANSLWHTFLKGAKGAGPEKEERTETTLPSIVEQVAMGFNRGFNTAIDACKAAFSTQVLKVKEGKSKGATMSKDMNGGQAFPKFPSKYEKSRKEELFQAMVEVFGKDIAEEIIRPLNIADAMLAERIKNE